MMAPKREQRPVSNADKPKVHPEWSKYSTERGARTGNR